MYIEPNSKIVLLKNCPIDDTYNHTLYFANAGEQESYFLSLAKYTLNRQSYQRVQRGKMRVEYKADDLYDCNYVMFQNTNYGGKWFYAFIKKVEFVNNITSEVEFEIDVMQTWFFDYTLGACFVEREHTATDVVGENTVPENLETGDYVSDDFDGTRRLSPLSIVVASTFDDSYEDVGGSIYAGLYSGLYYSVFENNADGAQACTDFIREAGSKTDGIVAVFLMPTCMVTGMNEDVNTYRIAKSKKRDLKRADGATVKNNKLLTYPYNFMYVSNLQGGHAVFNYEDFSGVDCSFILTGDMTPNPSAILVPTNYKGVVTNYDEKITLSGYPQLCYATDSYKQWLAQSGVGLAVNTVGIGVNAGATVAKATTLAATTTSAATAAGATIAASVAIPVACVAVAGILASIYQHSKMPDQAHTSSASSTMASVGLLDFAFMHKHIKPEYATIIDDYFTMYGYAVHRVKVPNRVARPHWTFTKTMGCVVHGSVPNDDMKKICGIYDKGITFWRNGNEVGNYYLDNGVSG